LSWNRWHDSRVHLMPHGRVYPQPVSIVRILIHRQPTEDRLAQKRRHRVLRVLARAWIVQLAVRHLRQAEDIIEFAVRQQTGVTRHLHPVELYPQRPVKIDSAGPVSSLTHSVQLRPVA